MKKQEDKTKNGYENRPQLGSGPTYSDSPSDNANSSITSSPTDTLRTSKNSAAKIIKNLSPIGYDKNLAANTPNINMTLTNDYDFWLITIPFSLFPTPSTLHISFFVFLPLKINDL